MQDRSSAAKACGEGVEMAQAGTAQSKGLGFRVRVQRFGSYLSGMVMPNIGAFIAWGLITAMFIPTGWIPNETLAQLVDPMILYLLPLLIGYTGGRIVHDVRGGVVGAIATIGVIVGSDIPMFLGALVMGPLGGYIIKQFDRLTAHRVRQGFEMLVNNFSAGIIGGALAIAGLLGIGPVVSAISNALGAAVNALIGVGLLPLVSVFVEPAKILFLNNAINHGILTPIAVEQARETGQSILFLVETNPGPGLGILLAYWVFGSGLARASAPGAIIIQFLGGIHEIYFPYVLMKPLLVFAAIAGGASGLFVEVLFGVGLAATPSPGSIFAILALTPQGNHLGVILGVLTAATVSFLVASLILRASPVREGDENSLVAATSQMQDMKGKRSAAADSLVGAGAGGPVDGDSGAGKVRNASHVVFACDAGMGSSAMGASLLRKKVNDAGLDVEVSNVSIANLDPGAEVVVTHKDLTDRAREKAPGAAHVSVDNFLNSPKYDELVEELKKGRDGSVAGSGNGSGNGHHDDYSDVRKVIFACDAGMGSSAMGASLLKKKAKDANLDDVEIRNTSINDLPNDADVVVTHKDLTERARAKLPGARHVSVDNFLNSPKYDELVERIHSSRARS
ncbi:mtlA: PTS system, mannitol-specific IIC component [Rubrobacter radiotolerans]|uniref:PTS system mannitol-specific EIICB component n=2 Tax=Rubrobacter radiotolerans TaxID=42256 RepID=A0A023X0V8_RUBRA|nr:mtlA: PTS system, mannitol-specific IIC component [Rubrobacter radiotolerans]SMC02958.1 PTS system, mannitol-specific IIC component [Rubrobacter radiotolerans DSM 5868]